MIKDIVTDGRTLIIGKLRFEKIKLISIHEVKTSDHLIKGWHEIYRLCQLFYLTGKKSQAMNKRCQVYFLNCLNILHLSSYIFMLLSASSLASIQCGEEGTKMNKTI